jgi:hypothetical protein
MCGDMGRFYKKQESSAATDCAMGDRGLYGEARLRYTKKCAWRSFIYERVLYKDCSEVEAWNAALY